MIIAGRVQGVWFRASTCRQAQSLALVGWVRNLADGTVEVLAQGDEQVLRQLGDWCRRGPSGARVDAVDAVFIDCAESFTAFTVAPDSVRTFGASG